MTNEELKKLVGKNVRKYRLIYNAYNNDPVEKTVLLIRSFKTNATPPSHGPRKYPIIAVPIKPNPTLTTFSGPTDSFDRQS